MFIAIKAIREAEPGVKWQALFQKYWPYYAKWFLSEGYTARPGYMSCYSALEQHMPELLPTYEQLCELAGGGDLPARFLSLYSPPPYLSGCSQIAWTKGRNALIRNYDYSPKLFDGVFLYSNWCKPVMAMVDCMWGALDGMNADGLAVSLSFGGKNTYGQGFGIPIVLRYLLETCKTVQEAFSAMERLPIHMQYNVTVMDASGAYITVFLSPHRRAEISHQAMVTNHQHQIEWEAYAQLTRTLERKEALMAAHNQPQETYTGMLERFMKPPLYNTQFRKGFGTLYTAAYQPTKGKAKLLWPHKRFSYRFDDFTERNMVFNTGEDIMTKVVG